ncbi:unnamed protein product [Paramecium sonneborni]|uniref:RING-type domain-containing protein n=1 Tax=Paramecium sonneborni TaxID=65129 RepID=A0A8S1K386_9CILI|nr:unnamed protein product [Paramecium sonneborni]
MGSQPQKSRSSQGFTYQQQRMQTNQIPLQIQMQYQQPIQQINNIPLQYSQTFQYNHQSSYIYNQSMQQAPASHRSTNTNTQPQVLLNEVCIEKTKLIGNDDLKIEFVVFALTPCKIQLFVQGQEIFHPVNNVFSDIRDKEFYDEFQLTEPQTKNVKITSKITVPKSRLKQKKTNLGQVYWKLIIIIQNQKMMMIYYYDYEDDQLKLARQKYQHAQQGAYEVQEIYGINDTNLVGSMKHDENDGDCIICLSEKIDTIIMPCRHMCLCGNCAKQIMEKKDQLKRQPPDRQLHAPDFNLCPQCRMEIDSFIKLHKVS